MSIITKKQSWFLNANRFTRAQVRLFCFPYAGGSASIYRAWQNLFPADIGVCPVQLPGRENRMVEMPISSLDKLVDELVHEIEPWLDMPFAFFGHSMGAKISFELTRRIQQEYGVSPVHLFVSASGAPHMPMKQKHLHLLSDAEFKQELHKLNGTPEAALQNQELMALLLPRIRADFAVCETYQYTQAEPLTCPISVFSGAQDYELEQEELLGWQEMTSGRFSHRTLAGDHFFIHQREKEIAQAVTADVIVSLRKRAVHRYLIYKTM